MNEPTAVVVPPDPPVEMPPGSEAATVIEAPPPEPTDASGVPYKNRIAEYERKLAERDEMMQRYQQVLGTYQQQQQQPAPSRPDVTAKFDGETQEFVRSIAREVANEAGQKFILKSQLQDSYADQELVREATPIYARLKAGSWANVPNELVEDRAFAEARAVVAARKQQAATQSQSQQVVAQANRNAAGASLPTATGGGPVAAQQIDAAKWLDGGVTTDGLPNRRRLFRSMFPGLDINSPAGQEKLRRLAQNEESR